MIIVLLLFLVIVWQAAKNVLTKKLSPRSEHMICVRMYNEYLEKAWPASGLTGGYGGLRAVQYDKIAASLRGENVCAMMNHWVKKWEFFLLHAAEGAGSAIAIPAVKGQVLQNHPMPGTYKLVARVASH